MLLSKILLISCPNGDKHAIEFDLTKSYSKLHSRHFTDVRLPEGEQLCKFNEMLDRLVVHELVFPWWTLLAKLVIPLPPSLPRVD